MEQDELIFVPVSMMNGRTCRHEVYIRPCNDEAQRIVIMISGIGRGKENDKSYDPRQHSALWVDGPGTVTVRSSPAGLGKSEGDTFRSTLFDRITLNVQIAEELRTRYPGLPISFAGASMGAHVAVRAAAILMERGILVSSLLLSSPCLYNDECETATYGDDFKQAANVRNSSLSIDVYRSVRQLEAFGGRAFVFYQEFDADINRHGVPDIDKVQTIVEAVMERRRAAKKYDEYFVIPDGNHVFYSDGRYPDPGDVACHTGSAMKREISDRAAAFLEGSH